jgi:hypothetical protein
MADYTLGQRLSYYWLFPGEMKDDFNREIGARRNRTKNGITKDEYLNDMRNFAKSSLAVLKENGFLATVIGAPIANAYKDDDLLKLIDRIFLEEGFELFWHTFRPINWHRNHGYARLKEEKIAVYVKL